MFKIISSFFGLNSCALFYRICRVGWGADRVNGMFGMVYACLYVTVYP